MQALNDLLVCRFNQSKAQMGCFNNRQHIVGIDFITTPERFNMLRWNELERVSVTLELTSRLRLFHAVDRFVDYLKPIVAWFQRPNF